MPYYLAETDIFEGPVKAAGFNWFGPLELEIPCDWIALKECEETEEIIVPETTWPTNLRFRRVDLLCLGVRPSRPMPRGLRFRLQPDGFTTGVEPPGLIDADIEVLDPTPTANTRDRVEYRSLLKASPRAAWEFTTVSESHSTLANPLSWDDDDFILDSVLDLEASDGKTYILLEGPFEYAGGFPLTRTPNHALAISRTAVAPQGAQDRSIVLQESMASCDDLPEATTQLNFFTNFDGARIGTGRHDWIACSGNTTSNVFRNGRMNFDPPGQCIRKIGAHPLNRQGGTFAFLGANPPGDGFIQCRILFNGSFGGTPELILTVTRTGYVIVHSPPIIAELWDEEWTTDFRNFRLDWVKEFSATRWFFLLNQPEEIQWVTPGDSFVEACAIQQWSFDGVNTEIATQQFTLAAG